MLYYFSDRNKALGLFLGVYSFVQGDIDISLNFQGVLFFCLIVVLVRKRRLNTLKPSYFVSNVVGLFVGFPRHKRMLDGFARCLMCRVDLSIAGRGLQNFWGHWKGAEHTRLEQKFRIMTQRPLLDKSCRPVSSEEDRRIRLERMIEPPVSLDSPISLSLEDRVALEREAEEENSRPVL